MPEDRDKDIAEKLMSEGPGILNWLKEGFDRYRIKTRLIPCEAITEQTKEYRADEDFYTPFFDSGSICIEKNARIQAGRLYSIYESWFKLQHKEDRKPASSQKFGRDMSTRFRKTKDMQFSYYLGIGESGQQKVCS
jgi:phage/plasmid-associated DNA primase